MITVLAAGNAAMSPSGLPLSQAIRAAGIVNEIVLPEIITNTPSSPTFVPNAVQDGRLNVVADVQLLNIHPLPSSGDLPLTGSDHTLSWRLRTLTEYFYFVYIFLKLCSLI